MTSSSTRSQQGVPPPPARRARRPGPTVVTPNGCAAARAAPRPAPRRHAVADPEPRQPVRLGERPQHDHVRPIQQVETADRRPGRRRTPHTPRPAPRRRRRAPGPGTPRRRLRAGPARSGCSGCTAARPPWPGVIAASMASRSCSYAGRQRHRHAGRPGELGGDRVRLEAAEGVDDLVPRPTEHVEQVEEDRHRPGAERDPLRRDAQPLGQGLGQRRGGDVGVAVDRPHACVATAARTPGSGG